MHHLDFYNKSTNMAKNENDVLNLINKSYWSSETGL